MAESPDELGFVHHVRGDLHPPVFVHGLKELHELRLVCCDRSRRWLYPVCGIGPDLQIEGAMALHVQAATSIKWPGNKAHLDGDVLASC